jgi:hypothetical protein
MSKPCSNGSPRLFQAWSRRHSRGVWTTLNWNPARSSRRKAVVSVEQWAHGKYGCGVGQQWMCDTRSDRRRGKRGGCQEACLMHQAYSIVYSSFGRFNIEKRIHYKVKVKLQYSSCFKSNYNGWTCTSFLFGHHVSLRAFASLAHFEKLTWSC